MSKLLCCENCGTMFDPQKGNCPICGGKAEQPSAPETPEVDTVMDDFLAGLGFSGPAPEEPQTPETSGGETPEDLDHTRQFTIPVQIPVPETPAPREEAPEETPMAPPVPDPRPKRPRPDAPKPGVRPGAERRRPAGDTPAAPDSKERPERRRRTIKKATITTRDKVVCLILATLVIFFALFILYRFLAPHMGNTQDTTPSTEGTSAPTEADLRCTSVLVEKTVTLTEIGQKQKLEITVSPANTTDMLEFSSDFPEVAMVTADGTVTAMAAGQANITITCGNVMAVCTVKCEIMPDETTAPTETTSPTDPTEELTDPTIALPSELVMDREDISFFSKGETTYLDVGDWTAVVTWESSDPSVAKVDARGLVTAVGGGTCTIYARLEHLEAKCIVRCRFESDPEPGEDDEDGDEEETVTISHTDVSLDEGETFTLRLKNQDGDTIEVQWQVEDEDICSVDGNRVKGLSSGTTTVYCTYKGTRYECIVRVR